VAVGAMASWTFIPSTPRENCVISSSLRYLKFNRSVIWDMIDSFQMKMEFLGNIPFTLKTMRTPLPVGACACCSLIYKNSGGFLSEYYQTLIGSRQYNINEFNIYSKATTMLGRPKSWHGTEIRKCPSLLGIGRHG
jgi:hypothetical protein